LALLENTHHNYIPMQRYHGKLLLFGEYTILKGSRALAMPLPRYGGQWGYSESIPAALSLEGFVAHLHKLEKNDGLLAELQLSAFEREVNKGLYFDSDIPVGYGVGSSGALCAAVYERFALSPISRQDESRYAQLKSQLAQLEGYFHGASSGTDPLICYLDQPVLLFPDGHVHPVDFRPQGRQEGHFFLLDTGISRKTGALVELFIAKCESSAYAAAIANRLVPATHAAIEAYLAADDQKLAAAVSQISSLQIEHFAEMIPGSCQKIWAEGLESRAYALKLCGAGGGGFILGYTRDFEAAKEQLASMKLILLEKN
jgi:mevalonate kinase